MVRIEETPLPAHTAAGLRRYQKSVDSIRGYARRVEFAAASFARYNRKTNKVFEEVKATLEAMCSGARRCIYCEDSAADEVEHHHPKNFYPEMVFDWQNYVYACGPCNGQKNNRFAIFSGAGEVVSLERKRGEAIRPPASGRKVLLHPRADDPLRFMVLDIGGGTFRFVPTGEKGSEDYKRGEYTIELLGLNLRAYLPRARKEAFGSYKARILEFAKERNRGADADELTLLAKAVRRMQHPTVLQEMRRQRELLPEVKKLFDEVPEALDW